MRRIIRNKKIFHHEDLYERCIMVSGSFVRIAHKNESEEMQHSFVGVTKINGEWWSVHKIFDQYTTVEPITW